MYRTSHCWHVLIELYHCQNQCKPHFLLITPSTGVWQLSPLTTARQWPRKLQPSKLWLPSPSLGLWFPHLGQSACCWHPIPDFTIQWTPLLPSIRFHLCWAFAVTPKCLKSHSPLPPHQEWGQLFWKGPDWPWCLQTEKWALEIISLQKWQIISYCSSRTTLCDVIWFHLPGFFFLSIKNNLAHWISTFYCGRKQ